MSHESTASATTPVVNGLDLAALGEVVEAVKQDPKNGLVAFRVTNTWKGRTRSEASIRSYELGGQEIDRAFTFQVDEPTELLGTNTAPNPQELLLSALNACMVVGYAANAALLGITLDKLEIESTGEVDLRGFLGLSDEVNPGCDRIEYVVRIGGNGTPEQFREIHEIVQRTSPNFANLTRPVRLEATLVVE
jgi:uncharacterized OsmC-like protein